MYTGEIWILKHNLPFNGVNAYYESQILMLINGRLKVHLGYLDVVYKETQATLYIH